MPTSEPVPPTVERFREGADLLGPYGCWPYVERRTTPDRRAARTRVFSKYLAQGKRASGRRRGESHNIYVDRYQTSDLRLSVAILALNILDAVFTLQYVGDDLTREANPFARFLLHKGYGWFIFGKAVVVAICVIFLAVHKNFRLVRPAMYFLLAFYFALFGYHIYLKFVFPVGAAV